jgi:hypothetical protein
MTAKLRSRAQSREAAPEYGDTVAVHKAFGLRETKVYALFNQGLIRGVLLRADKTSRRGKRLFSFESIRDYLRNNEATGDNAPKSSAGAAAVAGRMSKAAKLDAYKRGEE